MTDQPNDNRIIELPNLFQLKRGDFIARAGKFRKQYASKIEELYGRTSIDLDQYRAGDRLFNDAYHGGVLGQLKAIDYTRAKEIGSTAKEFMSELRADKHHEFGKAMFDTEIGRIGRDILWHVVIFDMSLKSYSENQQYTIGLLRETLNELVRYYKKQR